MGPLRCILYHIHGYGENNAFYDRKFRRLAEKGIRIYGLDLRGHGYTFGNDPSTHLFEPPYADIRVFLQVDADIPDICRFIMGFSMGGLFSLIFALEHEHDFSGIVLMGKNCFQ